MDASENTNHMLPTISVLISSYNYSRFIGGAIESVLNQSYQPMEIIIIDDASTDNSIEIIQQFVQQYPIVRLVKNVENIGIINVLNKFLNLARGEYISPFSADDRMHPCFLEKSVKLLARYPEAGLCSTLSYKIDEKGRNMGFFVTPIISTKACFVTQERAFSLAKKIGGWVPGNAVIYKRKALDSVGGFRPELRAATDAVAALLIACKYGACFIPEALSCMRVLPTSYSISQNENVEAKKELQKVFAQLVETDDIFKKTATPANIKNTKSMYSYMINTLELSNLQNKKISFLKEYMPPKRSFEKVLYVLIKIMATIENRFYHLYAFVHSERRIYPVIYNRLFRSLHFLTLYLVSKMRRTFSPHL